MQADQNFEVIILGYDKRRIAGGVITVTDVLLENLPNVRLHPVKHCYQPAMLDAWLYVVSFLKFVGIVIARRKAIVAHLIVGSRGDRVRAVPILLLCALFRVPQCIQYHKNVGGLVFKLGSARDRLLDRFYRLCDLHVFISPTLRREFLEMAPGVGESSVINNALPQAWMGLQVAAMQDRDIDLVFFGRWNAEKGIDVLLGYLQNTAREIRCEIYSDHIPGNRIRNAVVKPWVREEEVRSILKRARLLVLPSYYEAYPTVILEALACGTPFVASNVGGIPDIAAESEGGLVVEPGDSTALGKAIETVLNDPADWSRRSRLGWEWVNRTCNVGRVVSLWRETYAALAEPHRTKEEVL
jgi:glycosyltransferase involved in cell wall biosynthesis